MATVRPDARSQAGTPTAERGITAGFAIAMVVEALWLLFLAWMAVRNG